ncbi:hypothetical protein [Aliamphritea ceti]|uniref:hypothetical protein n=1 Tax=Aliamphritea ceti TaxID=1524258 RepID=UPI0021C2E2DA|nr:hypothetical protein [Aliamphritea ceti]
MKGFQRTALTLALFFFGVGLAIDTSDHVQVIYIGMSSMFFLFGIDLLVPEDASVDSVEEFYKEADSIIPVLRQPID